MISSLDPSLSKAMRICSVTLIRLLAICGTISAAIVMVTSHEKIKVFSVSFEAKYSHTLAFKYFFIANIVGSVYSIVVLFLPSKTSLSRLVLISDLIVTMVLTSSVSAALAVAQVGKKGNSHAGWLPICGQLHHFCDQIGGALIAAFISLILYMLLLFLSIYTLLIN
ncbi:CASP-like protein 1C1 [Lycium barbarum]|uniref:CASP-like protein 1C1 n=1 Tax=Lycium barbarum TaxID=112863 RepID=UPI00293EF4AB|nr:CASP-like protein 1C1 [Lycium barbarum]